ncbi:hypothetical protein [Halarcobacter sp.]|uniref:hypothetical protein n=1 Tax=Halarcobacter sp. TaxID=2321133 RepID=UPI002AABEDBA|nr:hypothetical protein [Halarcobacter sp.]
MQSKTNLNAKSYHNINKNESVINPDDIIKTSSNKFYSVINYIDSDNLLCTDINGNNVEININDIQKIIFKSEQQSKINFNDVGTKKYNFVNALKQLNKKLHNPNTTLSQIIITKTLIKSLETKIASFEHKPKRIQTVLF